MVSAANDDEVLASIRPDQWRALAALGRQELARCHWWQFKKLRYWRTLVAVSERRLARLVVGGS